MQAGLVEQAQHGDAGAFAEIAAAVVDRCYALAYRILRDPHRAQDATQQALLNAWQGLPTLRDPDRFEAWLHRLVVRACFMEARGDRRWTARVRLIPSDTATTPDPSRALADRDELEHAFRGLSAEHRAVVVLHHYLGYPLTEVAAILEIPVGTARSRLHYAIRELRAAIEADARPISPRERTA